MSKRLQRTKKQTYCPFNKIDWNTPDLIGLELSDAKDKLRGKKFRLVYYTSDKQKIFDKELVIRMTENLSEIVLTIGGFLFSPLE